MCNINYIIKKDMCEYCGYFLLAGRLNDEVSMRGSIAGDG